MGNESFNETLLTDKLSRLNSSQQSIECLKLLAVSRWCISHRKKAKQVVETWEKLFKSAQPQQQVSFLYLSNDILQNSRRKGSEFVNEFWKVLPSALKGYYGGGNENCREVASRLVTIWEDRKVFGSRGQNLKNEVLGKNPSLPVNNVKNANPIKVMKRDASFLRIKLAVGGLPERILTAMQLLHDEVASEEATLNKCHDAVSCVRELEEDVLNASSQGSLQAPDVIDNILEQEKMIQQCISELEKSEEIRLALVSHLREALQDQETKLEQIRSELLVARGQIEQAANIKLQLTSVPSPSPVVHQPTTDPSFQMPTTTHPLTPFSTDEESKKATAAVVAAKLAASTSSAQMLTSILSSLVAEEAASMSTGLKRPKLDPGGGEGGGRPAYFSNSQQVFANMPSGTTQSNSQANQLQIPFIPPPPPPPGPPATNSSNNMMGISYGYGGMAFPQPGPSPQQAQPPASGGYFRPVGVGFYGQPPTAPSVHRH
ncbi:hypothetical protein OROMI_024629 [Orobanche minor]